MLETEAFNLATPFLSISLITTELVGITYWVTVSIFYRNARLDSQSCPKITFGSTSPLIITVPGVSYRFSKSKTSYVCLTPARHFKMMAVKLRYSQVRKSTHTHLVDVRTEDPSNSPFSLTQYKVCPLESHSTVLLGHCSVHSRRQYQQG